MKSKADSVQEACVQCLAVHILKFQILQTNRKMKPKCSVFSYIYWKDWKLKHLKFFVSFFMPVSRFQISMCELLSIWCKHLGLSWLYKENIPLNFWTKVRSLACMEDKPAKLSNNSINKCCLRLGILLNLNHNCLA